MISIAHASIDENGKAKGGKAGDQTGKEVCIRTWYSKPWNCVIRFHDPDMREKVAIAMENAAKNNNIGYDQNQRNIRTPFPGRFHQPGQHPGRCPPPL